MGEVFAGRYEFVDLLDEGGMGAVWRVWDLRETSYRAAKVLKQSDSASLLRFVRETSWRIDHDHIVTPLGWSAEDDRVLFTMPLVAGGTVALLIKDYGRLPYRWSITLLDQLLHALEAVHVVGLVHRDVKPSNLLLDATGPNRPHLRLTDFGIAASVDEPRMTRVGDVIGTPGYLSPEARYGADPDPRHDLYAAGLVALEMLTGQKPGVDGQLEIPAEVSDGPAGQWLSTLLAPQAADRYASAAEARAVLATIQIPNEGSDEIEVFEHVPPLPEGWGPDGPRTKRMPTPLHPSPPQPATPTPVEPGQAPARSKKQLIAAALLILGGVIFLIIAVLILV